MLHCSRGTNAFGGVIQSNTCAVVTSPMSGTLISLVIKQPVYLVYSIQHFVLAILFFVFYIVLTILFSFFLFRGIALSTAEQEEFGRRCKRLIDTGRLAYLRSRGFKAVLTKYIDSTVSLENIALIATRTPGD